MKIIFISNAITPHQIPLCDELFALQDVSLKFIESVNVDKNTLPIGWRTSCKRDYVVSYDSLLANSVQIVKEIIDADAVIFGSGNFKLLKERLCANKLTFIYSERIYKNWRECIKYPYHFIKFRHLYGHTKALYLLCASAFSANDYNSLGLFRNKAFKWGYFTKVENSVEIYRQDVSTKEKVRILWCARFLLLKHPELAVLLAQRLKEAGYDFELNMIGNGDKFESIVRMIDKLEVADVVHLLGNMPNKEVCKQMREHDIFLFTSDQNEGWGAVSNEAMSNGCVLVGSERIGSVPYLISNNKNGMMFKSENLDSLFDKVKFLIVNPQKRLQMSRNGIDTMMNVWSPQNAAKSLTLLINDIMNNKSSVIKDGPCSKA